MFANRVFEIGMKCRYMNTGFMKYRSRIRNKKIRKVLHGLPLLLPKISKR
ncbi:hypothetical protein HanRHA438_Chr03g0139091 [Helianthus annuus]|nr:hypothetical protein HanIR_Chr03g0138981 [Helianthus annuus]KAJ0937167.1 hypothetical protein HanRHA438_Chr03g0139091 [Helianthus annuus]